MAIGSELGSNVKIFMFGGGRQQGMSHLTARYPSPTPAQQRHIDETWAERNSIVAGVNEVRYRDWLIDWMEGRYDMPVWWRPDYLPDQVGV